MLKAVFLNSGRVDYDKKLDFSALENITEFTKYEESNEKEILERVKDQNIVITKELPVGRELISKFPDSVKLICEAGTGFNNIDINAAKEKNIKVCNVPGYSTEAVAQLVITFILNLSSSLMRQQRMIENKNYDNFTKYLQVPHFEVQNKTLGVIGAGSIGKEVIRLARAFGMKVLVYNRSPRNWEDNLVSSATLEEVLAESDFVTIHCPLTEDTRHLIDMKKLKNMKRTSFIINTSRGAIIKEEDLIEALQQKIIAGAALDVQDPEPPSLDNPLFQMDNVILTPHIGWKCLEARQRLIGIVGENIEGFESGKSLNVIN